MAVPSELLVEQDGRVVAVLDDPQFAEMFWWRWRVTPVEREVAVLTNDFWDNSALERTVFRCRASGAAAETALWGGLSPVEDGRLMLRATYVPVVVKFRQHPVLWVQLVWSGGEAEGLDE